MKSFDTTMRKTYITPKALITHMQPNGALLQDSMHLGGTVQDRNSIGFAKENNQSSTPSYNVWDDDWSQ